MFLKMLMPFMCDSRIRQKSRVKMSQLVLPSLNRIHCGQRKEAEGAGCWKQAGLRTSFPLCSCVYEHSLNLAAVIS